MTVPGPRPTVVILGGGPAGLGAAWRLARRGFRVTVLERSARVGGNAGSFELEGLRVDYGSHRLHPASSPAVLRDVKELLGSDLLDRPRHGRILLRGQWVHFPLKPLDLALNLPWSFAAGVMRDALVKPAAADDTFAGVLERGLGPTICRDFYFPYARKLWGLSPADLDPEQARRRVSAGSVGKMIRRVLNAVPGLKPPMAGRFFYPRHGFGQISEAYANAAVEAGARVQLESTVTSVRTDGTRVTSVQAESATGVADFPADVVFSTIPVARLAASLSPAAPSDVAASAESLRSRAMILIYLVLERDRFTEYDAHYFPGADVPITRLSEPKNYGLASLPGRTVLCAELPCSPKDAVWSASDESLGALLTGALDKVGLPVRAPVLRTATRRLREAYPVYARGFKQHFEAVDRWLLGIGGLLSIGRQGLFAHDNTHHTLAMAYAACDCLNDAGAIDRTAWVRHRVEFESHVVED
jgi:protoporphyrinogen oxidase